MPFIPLSQPAYLPPSLSVSLCLGLSLSDSLSLSLSLVYISACFCFCLCLYLCLSLPFSLCVSVCLPCYFVPVEVECFVLPYSLEADEAESLIALSARLAAH